MIPTSISLHVVTPERQMLEESVDSIQLPGRDGYLGILPGHAPLITELGYGELTYLVGKEMGHLTVMGGYAEVLGDRVTVLAEVGEKAEEIDVDRAHAAKERAEKLLSKTGDPDVDWDAAELALRGYETLIIDCDPQANATSHFLAPSDVGISVAEVLVETDPKEKVTIKAAIVTTEVEHLDIVPSKLKMQNLRKSLQLPSHV